MIKPSLKQMISFGEEFGVHDLANQYDLYMHHYDVFFSIDNFQEELLELQKEMFYEYPDKFVEMFDCTKEELLEKGWKIKDE